MRGYYEYACYKFVDNVYASVDSELFMKCREKLTDAVKEHFRLDDPGGEFSIIII